MAKKISQLTQATEVKSDDVTVIVQDGETKKLPLNMMVTKQDIENKKIAGLAKLDEIEATYENDTYTPTITVKNKSSVKVGEGDGVDYSANVMDGHVKSAILKGKTRVNEVLGGIHKNISLNGTTMTIKVPTKILKTNTTYWFSMNVISNTCVNGADDTNGIYISNGKPFNGWTSLVNTNGNKLKSGAIGRYFSKLTTANDLTGIDYVEFFVSSTIGTGSIEINNLFICEVDGEESLPNYFEGMQSVKMPVLTTTGKNLFDNKILANYIIGEKDGGYIIDCYKLYQQPYILEKPLIGTFTFTYTAKEEVGGNNPRFLFYFNDGTTLQSYNGQTSKEYETYSITINNKSITKIGATYSNLNNIKWIIKKDSIQLEQGSTATSYEPYKSNILTVNEDVELRGIGDVQDTLDLITGEKVERIGEFVLNGNDETWDLAQDRVNTMRLNCYSLNIPIGVNGSLLKTDKFPYQSPTTGDQEGAVMGGGAVSPKVPSISILKTRLPSSDIDGFKQWLSQNPITVQYQLATESIKTVDLMPSGTHPSTTPYCWKNGLIQLSSSGLLPNLEYSVVTSRAGQINQNATMIVKNDKRIFDLEILLAGGLVNTTYQALTLQNQVETGLSKVSLNSETEPDYLLYHMIMKLIEEKAYKLDDLTEKVSVFYLYEKLSDEQFETIYSALYPFVEDEIVEEPVVEELPEVVEDEVIM